MCYAPECAFNILSLNRLNKENIHLNTGIKSLIFPAPDDMLVPRAVLNQEIKYEYNSWTLHQCNEHFGYPAFRAQYKSGKSIVLTSWMINSGLR